MKLLKKKSFKHNSKLYTGSFPCSKLLIVLLHTLITPYLFVKNTVKRGLVRFVILDHKIILLRSVISWLIFWLRK